jgi:transcriptional regulator with XRE-family HTH domain
LTDTESLADLVARVRADKGLSLRQVADASGGLISHTRVQAIEDGNDARVSDRVLRGLAAGLGISLKSLRTAAGFSDPTARPFTIPERANRLTQRERRLILEMIDTLLEAHRP